MSRMRTWIGAVATSVLSGAYWLLFLLMAEGFTASDYRPGMQPDGTWLTFKVVVAVVAGPLIHAALILLWRRLGPVLGRKG